MNSTTTTHIAVAGASGGTVFAIITIATKVLGHYGITIDGDTAAALMALLTPMLHLISMKAGLDPSKQAPDATAP